MHRLSARACLAVEMAGGAVAIAGLLFMVLDGWRRDLRVPLTFSGDALEFLMQSKGTIENGWWWIHPRLSAPGVFSQVDYPSATNVDQAIVWIVHWFTRDPGLCINVSWALMVVLSGLIATRCLTVLGVSRAVALLAGILYAFTPYGIYRNVTHFNLATYFVPVTCTIALLVALGRFDSLTATRKRALTLLCALIGLNYVYNAFFGAFLLLGASLMALASGRTVRNAAHGLLCVATICVATAINLAPSLYSWSEHGRPLALPVKHAAEAEQYGLKIRHLVSPVIESRFPPFRRWNELEAKARYPLENENTHSRLGAVATVGFLLLLGGLLVAGASSLAADPPLFEQAGRLTLALLLLGTVGGFGSLFSLLVSPEIRAYNRVTPFIAFLSLTALAMVAQKRLAAAAARGERIALRPYAVILAVVIIGLRDESGAARRMNDDHDEQQRDWQAMASFVGTLEARLPRGALVFQLPALTYLDDAGHEHMAPFDHIRPYIVSRSIHWSYPALSDGIVRWQRQVARLPPPAMATALEREGFSALLIDRYGYDDRGASLMEQIGSASADSILSKTERYVAIDLSRLPKVDGRNALLPRLNAPAAPATDRLPACRTDTAYNLEWIGETPGPFARSPVPVPDSGQIDVSGWAVDRPGRMAAGDLDIFVDGVFVTTSYYGLDRPDVASYLQDAVYRPSGFTARIAGRDLRSGVCTLSIRILAGDRSCYYEGPRVPIQVR